MHRCECPTNAVQAMPDSWYEDEELKAASHKANQCPGDVGVRQYQRGGQVLWLCSACYRPSKDVELGASDDCPHGFAQATGGHRDDCVECYIEETS